MSAPIPDLHPVASCPALVLAGGLGTRLRAIYDQGPKCMAPVKGRPFLAYLIQWLQCAGIRQVILCIGYKGEQIRNWLGDGRVWGVQVRYCVEEELRGTAGALRLASGMVDARTCLAINGDSFLEVNLDDMHAFHRARRADATLALARVQDSSRYGGVQLDAHGKIEKFGDAGAAAGSPPCQEPDASLINGGVYLLERPFFNSIPEGKTVSIEKEIFPGWAGRDMYGFVSDGFFIDIGVPADYARAQTELAERFAL